MDHLARVDRLSVGHVQRRAVDDGVALALSAGAIADADLAVAVHHDDLTMLVRDGGEVDVLDVPLVAGIYVGLLDPLGRGAADVEGPHRELRPRLADRLGGDHADGLAQVDELALREVAAVAQRAHTAALAAGEHRSDRDVLDAGLLDDPHLVLVELGARGHKRPAVHRVDDVIERNAPKDAIAEPLDDLTALDEL